MGGETNFCLMGKEVWLSLGAFFTHFPSPTLQVIIAQSLRFACNVINGDVFIQ